MGDVIDIRRRRKATLQEKADLYYRALQATRQYILFAAEKGLYKDWKVDGYEVAAFIERIGGL